MCVVSLFEIDSSIEYHNYLAFFFFNMLGIFAKTVLQVVQMGLNLQKIDKHTEQTNPTSTNWRWQKQAALKSTLAWGGSPNWCLELVSGK